MFNCAQCFLIPKSIVQNSAEADITSINLYYKSKPSATNTRSGIVNPGTSIYIVPVIGDSIPDLTKTTPTRLARAEYASVLVSDDASVATTYRFSAPIPFPTDSTYAVVVKFDGDEAFELYKAASGQLLDSDNTQINLISTDPNTGKFYTYTTPTDTSLGDPAGLSQPNAQYMATFWTSSSTALKMDVNVARYSFQGDANLSSYSNTIFNSNSGVTFEGNSMVIMMPSKRYEYIICDDSNSTLNNIVAGDEIFQDGPSYPNDKAPAFVSVTANSTTVTTSSLNFSTIFNLNGTDPEYIVLKSPNQWGANADGYFVAQVLSLNSNTSMEIDTWAPWTNSNATFSRSPIMQYSQMMNTKIGGVGRKVVVFEQSTANSSLKFVSNTISNVSVTSGGSGYSNTDYIVLNGYDFVAGKVLGNYPAKLLISTNANGTIQNLYFSNTGSGYSNVVNITATIYNSSNDASTGTGATFSYTVGSNLKSHLLGSSTGGGSYLANFQPVNLEIGDMTTSMSVTNPTGTVYNATQRFPYYRLSDTSVPGGYTYYCDADGQWDSFDIQTLVSRRSNLNKKNRVLPSWSNEFNIPYANGTPCNALGGSTAGTPLGLYSNSSVITFDMTSNNDFAVSKVIGFNTRTSIQHYMLNNSSVNEETDYGVAWAKGIETSFTLANNAFAEDLLVYATVYRPPGSNVEAFARIFNTNDADAFGDKDWTRLDCISGSNTYSSALDTTNTFEMTWGIPSQPPLDHTLAGSVVTTNASNIVTGSGVTWTSGTDQLVTGDIVKIYSTLFPTTNYTINRVMTVNATAITIDSPVSNAGIIGSGLAIDKLKFPHQAFKTPVDQNIAAYYNLSGVRQSTFNAIQLKLVYTSSNTINVPYADDLRAIASSS